MIQFKKVSKSFGTIKALEEVSFEVGKGEFVYITGPSGAGKTTLLKLILREYQPDSGEIVLEGVDITKLSDEQIPEYRQKIGVVFQDYKLLPFKKTFENVAYALEVIGAPDETIRRDVAKVLDIVGLSERIHNFPQELSGGEKQKVVLAGVLAMRPSILLLDEPLASLDPASAREMLERAGFRDVCFPNLMESDVPELRGLDGHHLNISFVVEARKEAVDGR